MCKWGTTTDVMVKIPADLSSTSQSKWKREKVDSCIADLVRALQNGGIDMRGSCCGHGEDVGAINLQDGRTLLVVDSRRYHDRRGRYLFGMLCRWLAWLLQCRNYRGRIRYWVWKHLGGNREHH